MNNSNYLRKSSITEIRTRFDQDVERFSNLETGQQTVIDSSLSIELVTSAASVINPSATELLDIGCGAGNYSLRMLEKIPALNCTLIDLSLPMLNRAKERIEQVSVGRTTLLQTDILEAGLPEEGFDIVLAGAVLHHLRDEEQWKTVFKNVYRSLKPGGSFWISDLIVHDHPALDQLFQGRYAEYLDSLGGPEYRKKVFDYIEAEDTPRSVTFQVELMRSCGFRYVDILHKNSCFATFGGVK